MSNWSEYYVSDLLLNGGEQNRTELNMSMPPFLELANINSNSIPSTLNESHQR